MSNRNHLSIESLRISLLQTDIIWENKEANLFHLYNNLKQLKGTTDIVVLPEMFTTGFSMNSHELAEPVDGNTIQTLQRWASEFQLAIVGSYIASSYPLSAASAEERQYYNRGFFITPEQTTYYYDKRHLFRMGNESENFSPGNNRIIIPFRGWNILLLVCYDLRFPVWSRNVNNEYDLLIYVANWPKSRRQVWHTLLQARSIENMSYVCGVNRVGKDGNNIAYQGGSMLFSAKGELLSSCEDDKENYTTFSLDYSSLNEFREKFPAWKDADPFHILS